MEEINELVTGVKRLQKELYKSRNLLNSLTELDESLNTIYKEFEEIEKMMNAEKARNYFREQLKQGDISQTYSEINSKMLRLKTMLERAENKNAKINTLLDSFTTAKSFSLSSEKNALQFLEEAFSFYGIVEADVKPEFRGVVALEKIERDLGLKRDSKGHILLEVEKIGLLLDYLAKSRAPRNLLIQKAGLKAQLKYPATVIIEAENSKIKRINRLYKDKFSFAKG